MSDSDRQQQARWPQMERQHAPAGPLTARPPAITRGQADALVRRGARCQACGGRLYVREDREAGYDLSDLACLACGREAAQIVVAWLPRSSLAPERPGAARSGARTRKPCLGCGRLRPAVDFDGEAERCRRCWERERAGR